MYIGKPTYITVEDTKFAYVNKGFDASGAAVLWVLNLDAAGSKWTRVLGYTPKAACAHLV